MKAKYSVLIIESRPEMMELFASKIEDSTCAVDRATDINTALKFLTECENYDLVLYRPEALGPLAKRIQEIVNETQSQIPAVSITTENAGETADFNNQRDEFENYIARLIAAN